MVSQSLLHLICRSKLSLNHKRKSTIFSILHLPEHLLLDAHTKLLPIVIRFFNQCDVLSYLWIIKSTPLLNWCTASKFKNIYSIPYRSVLQIPGLYFKVLIASTSIRDQFFLRKIKITSCNYLHNWKCISCKDHIYLLRQHADMLFLTSSVTSSFPFGFIESP